MLRLRVTQVKTCTEGCSRGRGQTWTEAENTCTEAFGSVRLLGKTWTKGCSSCYDLGGSDLVQTHTPVFRIF